MKAKTIAVFLSSMLFGIDASAADHIRCSVTYISASVIYLNAGREAGFAVGDTAEVFHHSQSIGKLYITAVSKKTSSAQMLDSSKHVSIGDSVASVNVVEKNAPAPVDSLLSSTGSAQNVVQQPRRSPLSLSDRTDNVVTGRAGIQYIAVWSSDPRFNISQPAPLLRLDIRNLYGTGLVFSMYGRSYFDLTDRYIRSGNPSPLKIRMYEFQLHYDEPDAAMGYGFGRMNSRFVAGAGMFDGGQVYTRQGNFTGGVLFGANSFEQSLDLNRDYTKGALFVNYRNSSTMTRYYDGTVAYVRQSVRNKLDREFLYFQNSMAFGPELSLYQSSELDLNEINNGTRTSAFKLSNTFVSLNYYPLSWLNANVGYDGTRSIYLFESMKSFSDTLLDKNMLQGFRANATVQLPYFIYLSGGVVYRTKKGDARDARTLSTSIRAANIFDTEVNARLRYAHINGVYSDGENIAFDIDQSFFYRLTVSLRFDYYVYKILSLNHTFITRTIGGNVNYRISRTWYVSLYTDKVFEEALHNMNIFAEIGIRF